MVQAFPCQVLNRARHVLSVAALLASLVACDRESQLVPTDAVDEPAAFASTVATNCNDRNGWRRDYPRLL